MAMETEMREQERLAGLEATAAAFAHEIGNRLSSLSTSVQLLEREIRKQNLPSNEKIESFLSGVMGEINRMGTLLQDVRSLIRPVTLHREPTDSRELCDEVLKTEAGQCSAKGIRLETEFGSSCPEIVADRDKIKQVLLNVLKNAVEAMPDGGIMTLRCYSVEDALFIEVEDTGIGVPEGLNIFEPFKTTKTAASGLGLAVVRQIVFAHGGDINFAKRPGAGTLFRIRLPLERPS